MPRGSAPGERRGGRKKGTPNKIGRELRELCREHTPMCVANLVAMAENKTHASQLGAIKELLDRGWGKAATVMTGEGGEGQPTFNFVERRIVEARPDAED